MHRPLSLILDAYDASAPLEEAWTIPSAWYTDPRVFELERRAVFGRLARVVMVSTGAPGSSSPYVGSQTPAVSRRWVMGDADDEL